MKYLSVFSQAIIADRTIYVQGCTGFDKDTQALVPGGVIPETVKALENVVAILEAGGSCAENVVKATIFVQDMGDFAKINDEYKKGLTFCYVNFCFIHKY